MKKLSIPIQLNRRRMKEPGYKGMPTIAHAPRKGVDGLGAGTAYAG
jgi:hypothetical protein